MKSALILLVPLIFSVADVLGEDKYTTKYDNVDVDAVINSERLLNGYVNCLLDRGACTPDASELKSEYSRVRDCLWETRLCLLVTLMDDNFESILIEIQSGTRLNGRLPILPERL